MTRTGPLPESLEGLLDHDGGLVPVTLRMGSRISLSVTFTGEPPPKGSVFPRLVLTLQGRRVELSRCRLQFEGTAEAPIRRLLFLDDVYDCRALFTEGKLVNLKAFFHNLPLMLAQKERVRPEFREHVADCLYDLAVYRKFFNEQDRIFSSEPPAVAAQAQEVLLRGEGRGFLKVMDGYLEKLRALVAGFDKEEHERHGFYLRQQAWDYILASEFLKHTNLKPRGYAGDAELMEMVYDNRYVGSYVFNKLLHKHGLETPAAEAVRNRRTLVAQALRQTLDAANGGKVRFLSVASGPARELEDIFDNGESFERLEAVLLDQDHQAIAYAQARVETIEAAWGQRLSVAYFEDSVRTLLRARDLPGRFGRFRFIYSMGLFDYLTPPVARAVLAKLYQLLHPGGTLLVGNYHVTNPTQTYMAYWMDWVLYHRTEDDFREMAEGLEGADLTIQYDPSGCQMFLHLTKES